MRLINRSTVKHIAYWRKVYKQVVKNNDRIPLLFSDRLNSTVRGYDIIHM